MRKLAAIALLFSAQAFACPDLAGSYTCTYQDGSSEQVAIAQDLKDGVTVYTLNGSQIPADNQTYPVPDSDALKQATFRAWCDANDTTLLQAQILGKYYNNGSYFGDMTLNMTFSRAGQDLKQVSQGTLKSTGGDEYPLNSDTVCTRN